VVFGYQGNRNPFIDRPDWAGCVHRGACPGTALPSTPASLVLTSGAGVELDWANSTQTAVIGFRVYRSASSAGPFMRITPRLLANSSHVDLTAVPGNDYVYRVCSVDAAGRESSACAEIATQPGQPPSGGPVVINELHYDNDGADTGEAVEIAGPSGTDLGGWRLIAYNGSGGGAYATLQLSGVIPDQQGCSGVLSFSFTGLQNGSPDGLALVDPSDNVVQFLSYEGSLTATDGAAAGQISTDLGVSEGTTSPIGRSLQRTGNAGGEAPFAPAAPSSFGTINPGQNFDGC
jgi:hypothetical protein